MEAGEELAVSTEACFKLHGKNILLSDDGRNAERTASYNHGIVISRHPLRPGHVFRVCQPNTLHLYHYCLGGAAVRRRTRGRKVAGSTPGQGAIKSTRSTQPSITPG